MKTTLKLLAILFTVGAAAHAQVAPAATAGPANLDYTVRYSETAGFSSTTGDWQTITPSGSVDYANGKLRHLLNLNYVGGYIWTSGGPNYPHGVFQRLFLSQGFVWRKWHVMASDDVSYRPQSPITGFSGIPGVGEPIGGPGSPSDQSIITNARALDNTASGELGLTLNHATGLSAGGSSNLLRFPDGNGLDTDTLMANAELTRSFNARNWLSGTYMLSEFSYPGYTALFRYNHEWNARLSTYAAVGPQMISSSDSLVVPPSTRIAVKAGVNYRMRFGAANLSYNRGTYGGAGYLIGAETDSVSAYFSREYRRRTTFGFEGTFNRTSGLQKNGVTNAKYAGAQVTRRLGRHFNLFANYTAIDQSSSSLLSTPVLSTPVLTHLYQVVGFGFGYSPQKTRLVRP